MAPFLRQISIQNGQALEALQLPGTAQRSGMPDSLPNQQQASSHAFDVSETPHAAQVIAGLHRCADLTLQCDDMARLLLAAVGRI